MKRLLALFIISTVLLFSLVSCGGEDEKNNKNNSETEETKVTATVIKKDEEKIIGVWEAELDFSETISDITSDGDEELAKYLTVDGLKTTYLFDFDKDGNVKISVDEEAFQEKLEALRDKMEAGYRAYYDAMLKSYGFDMTADEYLEETGFSIEGVVNEALDPDSLLSAVGKLSKVGKYRLDNGKVHIDENQLIYCFNSDTVLIFMLDVSQMTDEASLFFPMTLIKK